MSEFWSTFARSGVPAAQGQPARPACTTGRRATMFIEADCRVVDHPLGRDWQEWEGIDD